ncbi:cobyrinate a,c-diamide synthase [Luteipulveratus halotolerans]|uniref:Hydrogenobyrinate a,c-diamide synthase n=1 Tax=Luteipulveratus halotolerans TaxID=1631356 RepID=A0A0L6CN63_9MICO|nr:cobyrinate a,c-diamide synthase [Luteipulveratus halotolerans]KNX39162.1 cobyrinic acid a,c-diamide synthase [Luteipulveratus halotolerans]
MTHLPRVVIAAPASGHGKTTVATGLMAALRRRGLAVSGHKVGPDYIDPGYHGLATGRPGRNLDPQMVGEERLVPLLLNGARGADVAVVEGVMGLYDGATGRQGFASTAHVAGVLDAPVVLVVDVSHAARSVAAVVHGMATFDPSVRVAGVILNKVASDRHAAEVRDALVEKGFDVLGVLHRDAGISAPGRHLGLVPVAEQRSAEASIDRLASRIEACVDLDAVLRVAATAPALDGTAWSAQDEVSPVGGEPLIAVAGGRAFTFRYAETDELLRAAGCRVVEFDPLVDRTLPQGTQGIYLGGGFPETHLVALAGNTSMLESLRSAVRSGVPTVAECAGLLYLCETLDGTPMVGAVPADARMTARLTLGYRRTETGVVGHEFHRTTLSTRSGETPAWVLDGESEGFALDPAGVGHATLHASYLHTHWAGNPSAAEEFADRGRRTTPHTESPSAHVVSVAGPADQRDMRTRPASVASRWHHGDRETGPGLVDLAVNVQHLDRPQWLDEALHASLRDRSYPDASRAVDALAARFARPAEQVLPTAGAAEAFTLIARARPWRQPVVVHPQFREPDRALLAAGHTPTHVVLHRAHGFELDPSAIPGDADLVVIGNPTNPTGRLHSAAAVRALCRPGRVVVVDEAFMDAVPGEPESVAGVQDSGLFVIRSLTKTWAIPGVRAGFVLGDPDVLSACAEQQPEWSVSSPALAALVACASPEARIETAERAAQVVEQRRHLERLLAERAIPFVEWSAAPFVLAQVGDGVRDALRDRGIAVRRADTFPGLDTTWVRIATRDHATTARLAAALDDVHQRRKAVLA